MDAKVKRVVLVAIDGLSPDAIDQFALFNLRRLLGRGTSALTARSVDAECPAGRFVSLFTGVSPSRHGVTSNRSTIPGVLSRLETVPSLIAHEGFQSSAFFSATESSGPSAALSRQLGFNQISVRGAHSSDVVSSALNSLCTQRRGLIAMRFSDVIDLTLESLEGSSYAQRIERIDRSIGILASLSGAASGDSLLVVILNFDTSDNAQLFSSTGSPRTKAIFFGRCVRNETLDEISFFDVPATILWALGFAAPLSHEGKPLERAFDPAPDAIRVFA